ncbi:AKR_collapsed_G0035010.mRNA.1.CDS.1 [Saccharomyces cerevisiae]|nr:AKR_collapsed_G0035010.mRNA.1.CDS.1 [Saccharomyces cerevisiae]
MNTKSLDFYEPLEIDGQKYIKMTKKEDQGVYEAGVTQEAFTAKDKYDYKGIVENLERYGLCIVPSFIEPSKCDQILEELDPHFYRHDAWQGSPFPKETTVVDKSSPPLSYCLEGGCVDRLFCDMANHFLNEKNYFLTGNVIRKCSSGIQLNSGIVYKVGAGAGDQGYHREDHIHHTIHQACDSFQYGKETLLGVGVAFTDMNKANGATRVIIGSHFLYHAASANHTLEDRIAGYFFMSQGYLKQEENLHFGTDPEFFKDMPLETLKLLGLTTSEPYCGHIDYKSPGHIANPSLFENEVEKGYYGETIKIIYDDKE